MTESNQSTRLPMLLGIEAGGTRTVVVAVEFTGSGGAAKAGAYRRSETGPANLRLVTDDRLRKHFQEIASAMPNPIAVAIGMAGARTEADRERIRRAAGAVWPGTPCHATNDLETALMAADEGGKRSKAQARVLVLSGTGSCCFGRNLRGKTAKIGGWGHILGDKGSGFEIGLRALKAVVYYYDCDGKWPALGERMLRSQQLNEPDDLIDWVKTASKTEIAGLAREVFEAAAAGEKIARDILKAAAESLAKDAAACAARLVNRSGAVQFVLAGSVLLKQPHFARRVGNGLCKLWRVATIVRLEQESVWGAVELARRVAVANAGRPNQAAKGAKRAGPDRVEASAETKLTAPRVLSPTELRHPLSMDLDKLSFEKAMALMLEEDRKLPAAILQERGSIESALKLVVRSFRRGGRLFYAGAGTSGRLGVLDASECPPTFRTPPEMVQSIIAGGQRAIWEAVEGAEDDSAAGARAVAHRGVGWRDVVIGIAASGRTPFVWGALREAKRIGASTVLLCFNPAMKTVSGDRPDLIIAPNVGPEILTGSTRLKAGTATKLILNMITTLAMVRLGKVVSNLMVDVKASNTKLRDRAARIVQELTGADYATARAALEKAEWKVKPACQVIKKGKGRARRV